MKYNKMLQIFLVVLVVVFLAAGGFIYSANSSKLKKQTQLKNTLSQSQTSYRNDLAQKTTLQNTNASLTSQLAAVQALLAAAHFRSSAESLDYDGIIYALASTSKVQVTSLMASAPAAITEGTTVYQAETFTISVTGFPPNKIFAKASDDSAYITTVVSNIQAFLASIAASPDFDTTTIQSVNLSSPPPMTDTDIKAEIDGINAKIASENQDQITVLTNQITSDNAYLPQAQIDVLVKTAVDKLVASALAAQSAGQIQILIDQAGITTPSAVITINVWTSQGA
jgi:hypothetical protein